MDIKVEYEPEIGSTEYVFETVNLPTNAKNIALWSNEETKELIDLYKNLINEVGPFKRFKLKKDMWMEISSQIKTKNFKQCEERFKTLLRRKKKGIEKVFISDAKRKMLDFEDDDENEFQIIRKHKINFGTDECRAGFKSVHVWSNSDTKLLMDLYKRLICEVGPQKKFVHKKDMWAAIATNFENKDPKQCEQRYNTVLKRKHKNVTKVYITKARRKTIDFKQRYNNETLKINRAAHLLDNDIEKIDAHTTKKTTASPTDNKEALSISETLLKIAAKKEEGKERRHKEKMEAIGKLQNTLQKILNDKK